MMWLAPYPLDQLFALHASERLDVDDIPDLPLERAPVLLEGLPERKPQKRARPAQPARVGDGAGMNRSGIDRRYVSGEPRAFFLRRGAAWGNRQRRQGCRP